MSRYKPTGWRGESHRHYLAAKGIKTKHRYYSGQKFNFKRYWQSKDDAAKKFDSPVPIVVNDPVSGNIYPVSPESVAEVLKNQDQTHLDGIEQVEFVNPKGIQKQAWAQYVRSTNTIKIFSQPFKDGKIDGLNADDVNKHIREYVIPHEVGHHRALEIEKITDEDIEMAETRADAHVFGFSPKDSDLHAIWSLRNNN